MMSYGKGSKTATSNGPGKGVKRTSTLKRTTKDVSVKKSVAGADTSKPKSAPLPIHDTSERAQKLRKGKMDVFKMTAPAAAVKAYEERAAAAKRKTAEMNRELRMQRAKRASTPTPPARRKP